MPSAAGLRLVREPGGRPLAIVPVQPVSGRPPAVEYPLPAGSVWFAADLLAAADGYAGLRISGGTLRFGEPLALTSSEVVVAPQITVELDLALDPPPVPSGEGPGADARAATVLLPARARLAIEADSAVLSTTGPIRLTAYGAKVTLAPAAGPVTHLPDLGLLVLPLAPATPRFAVSEVRADIFRPAGVATIGSAGWALPVDQSHPAGLDEASGAGALLLRLDTGLRATWHGLPGSLPLGPATLIADPAVLTVDARTVPGERYASTLVLGADRPASTVTLSAAATFPLSFLARAEGSDRLQFEATVDASISVPVDVRGDRIALHARDGEVSIVDTTKAGADTKSALRLTIRADLSSGAGAGAADELAFGLHNGVLKVNRPRVFLLNAEAPHTDTCPADTCPADTCPPDRVSRWPVARAVLLFPLLGVVPALPDPYAANHLSLHKHLARPSSDGVVSVTTWGEAGTAVRFAFTSPGLAPEVPGRRPTDRTDLARLWARQVPGAADALAFEGEDGLILLDVSSNVDRFGVAVRQPDPRQADRQDPLPLEINGLTLAINGGGLSLLTVPAVQWEAVHTVADPDPTFPPRLGFANSGVPNLVTVPQVRPVPITPGAVLRHILDNFAEPQPRTAYARLTLPFGMLALAELRASAPDQPRGVAVTANRPAGRGLTGGHQLRIDAVDPSLDPGESASMPGHTVQLPVGQPGGRSVLGDTPTAIFNSYLGDGGARPLVPLRRLDLSGYGASVFSDWRNPYTAPDDDTAVTQVRFDVLVGRTAHEVVQVRTWLLPYAVQVVRTITMVRGNHGRVVRTDSGWQAVSDGRYRFPETSSIATHPGVVSRAGNVGHIRETGHIRTAGGVRLAAVYFDADLALDGADGPVPARDQLGFLQITGGTLIGPDGYAELLAATGPLGGPVDAEIRVGGGPQRVRVHRVGAGVAAGPGGPEFVMTAWGTPVFPGGGEWSVLSVDPAGGEPQAVPRDLGVPLIRAGLAGTDPPPGSPYRFADAADLHQPANPLRDYGILHATGTQRVLFPRPAIAADDPARIAGTMPPALADPFGLAGAAGLFPPAQRTIPFPSADWTLRVGATGDYRLELPAHTFPAGVGRRTLRQAGSVRSDIDYGPATVTYEVDTAAPVPWRFRLDRVGKIMNSTDLGDVIRLDTDIVAQAGAATILAAPRLRLGGALTVVEDLLTILDDLGITGALRADMTNKPTVTAGLTVPFIGLDGKPFQIPPAAPKPQIKFDDTELKVTTRISPVADEGKFELTGQPMFAVRKIPDLYVAAVLRFGITLSTEDGKTYDFLLGVGLAFDAEAGPLEVNGLLAVTFSGFIGENSLGWAAGILARITVSLKVISLEMSMEGKLGLVRACLNTPDSTLYGIAKLTIAVEVSVCFLFSISIEAECTGREVLRGPGPPLCPEPDAV